MVISISKCGTKAQLVVRRVGQNGLVSKTVHARKVYRKGKPFWVGKGGKSYGLAS